MAEEYQKGTTKGGGTELDRERCSDLQKRKGGCETEPWNAVAPESSAQRNSPKMTGLRNARCLSDIFLVFDAELKFRISEIRCTWRRDEKKVFPFYSCAPL